MTITVLSLFPEIVEAFFSTSLMKKALDRGLVSFRSVQIRDYAQNKHKTCDDVPYGGGAGMVLKAEPLAAALDAVHAADKHVIYPSPSGRSFTQAKAWDLSRKTDLVFVCGRYEGIDQRIIDEYVDEELSLGDYVLSSGEVATLVMVDAIYRLVPGVISGESLSEESFSGDGLLEYPHYTRPEVWRERPVPPVLLSGHHAQIEAWRHEKRIEKTRLNRPDLLARALGQE